jgi:hypothetical protein
MPLLATTNAAIEAIPTNIPGMLCIVPTPQESYILIFSINQGEIFQIQLHKEYRQQIKPTLQKLVK